MELKEKKMETNNFWGRTGVKELGLKSEIKHISFWGRGNKAKEVNIPLGLKLAGLPTG